MVIRTVSFNGGDLIVNSPFLPLLQKNDLFSPEGLWKLDSEPVKNVLKERGTSRAWLEPVSGNDPVEVYVKRYLPLPFKERVKNLFSLKRGFNNAFHEWNALLAFHRHGLPTIMPVAVARSGNRSCNITLGIRNYIRGSEIFAPDSPLTTGERKDVVKQIAWFAAKMHACNMAHQDFYLVHMFFDKDDYTTMYLIDLQRVVLAKRLSRRWLVKDLAQLIFSARGLFSADEIKLFMLEYVTNYNAISTKKIEFLVFKDAFIKTTRIIKRHERKKGQ